MDHDGAVSRPNLDFGHFIDDISDGLEVRTFPVWSPVNNVELGHLVGLTRLQWWGGGTYSLYSTLQLHRHNVELCSNKNFSLHWRGLTSISGSGEAYIHHATLRKWVWGRPIYTTLPSVSGSGEGLYTPRYPP